MSAPAGDSCSGSSLIATPGHFKLSGLKSRRCEVVGGFLGAMVTFPACPSCSSGCFTLCSTAVFTGPGKGYKGEHRETRTGDNQKCVPAEFVKITRMQSRASHWGVNLLAQCLQGNLSSSCPYPGFLMLPPPLGRGILSGPHVLHLGFCWVVLSPLLVLLVLMDWFLPLEKYVLC